MQEFKLPRLPAGLASLSLLAGLAFSMPAHTAGFDEEAEREWKEVELQLPEAPKPENLLPFYHSGSLAFALDAKSLSIAADGTVRYTLVAVSSAGARNISYEAIRCQSYERKLYAFGRTDGSWSRSRREFWEPISNRDANKQHSTLYSDFFCEGKTVAGKAESILNKLRRQKTQKFY